MAKAFAAAPVTGTEQRRPRSKRAAAKKAAGISAEEGYPGRDKDLPQLRHGEEDAGEGRHRLPGRLCG